MIKRKRIKPVANSEFPILVAYGNIANWATQNISESVHNFVHCSGLSCQVISVFAPSRLFTLSISITNQPWLRIRRPS